MSDNDNHKTLMKGLMESMHRELAEALLERIRSGEAKASDLNVARQFLNDNHIETPDENKSPIGDLAKSLPDLDKPQLN